MRKHHPLIIFILSLLLSVIHAKQLCSEGVLSAKDLTTNTSSSQLCCHADCGSCGDEGRHHFKCAKKYRLKDVFVWMLLSLLCAPRQRNARRVLCSCGLALFGLFPHSPTLAATRCDCSCARAPDPPFAPLSIADCHVKLCMS